MTRDGASITQDKSAEITKGLELPAKMPRLDRVRKITGLQKDSWERMGWEQDYCRSLMRSRIKSGLRKENTRSEIGWLAPLGS